MKPEARCGAPLVLRHVTTQSVALLDNARRSRGQTNNGPTLTGFLKTGWGVLQSKIGNEKRDPFAPLRLPSPALLQALALG